MTANKLPRGASAIIDAIGYRLGIALCATMNSGFLYVPVRLKPDHQIVNLVGHAAAEKLVAKFGGQTIHIPLCSALQRSKRNKEIRSHAAEGMRPREIARQFGLTVQAVRYILRTG